MVIAQQNINRIYFVVLALCLTPFLSPSMALVLGIIFAQLGLKAEGFKKHTSTALKASIVLMGFGMNLTEVISASKSGFLITAVSVLGVMLLGALLGKLFKVDSKTTTLISAGTAICGGSAIAAVAPVLRAKNTQISFSLAVIFILNALALVIFPPIGQLLHMGQETFGTWAAIAIHDTSSVVGAGATYGPKALEVATTVKLIRALWIIPLSLLIAFTQRGKGGGKIQIPWFIGLFVLAIITAYFLPEWSETFNHLQWMGKKGMVMALFLIGSSISIADAREAGARSFALGITLWVIISVVSLLALTVF